MDNYFTINKNGEKIYIKFDINKTLKYYAHGNNYYYYRVILSEFIVDDNIDFDDTYGGIFLWKTEDNELQLYDNIKKSFINLNEMTSGDNTLIFNYYSNTYSDVNLEFVIKEILFNIFVKQY